MNTYISSRIKSSWIKTVSIGDSLDWKPGISREEIIARVMKKVKNGSIILFHNDTPHTANVLPAIISSLKNQGYTIVPVSKIIFKENYYMDFDGKQKRKN